MIFVSHRHISPFLTWGDVFMRSRFAPSTIPKEKLTTRSLKIKRRSVVILKERLKRSGI